MDDFDDFDFNDEVLEKCFIAESQALQKLNNRTNDTTNQKKQTATKVPTTSFQDEFACFEDFSSWSSPAIKKQAEESARAKPVKNSMENFQEEVNTLKGTVKDMEEQILIKQGEISNLRRELMRKEQMMQTEILERYDAVEAAEKKGVEKGNKRLLEAQQNVQGLQKQLEKVKSSLNFKTHEVDQLAERCRKLESQKNNNMNISLQRMSQSLPHKQKNFADRFDFCTKPNVRNIEVQTSDDQNDFSKYDPDEMNIAHKGSLSVNNCAFAQEGIQYMSPFYWSLTTSATHDAPSRRSDVQLIIEKACGQLDAIRQHLQAESPGPWENVEMSAGKWYQLNMRTHLNMLRLNLSEHQGLLCNTIESLEPHILPIEHHGVLVNADCRYDVMMLLGHLMSQSQNLAQPIVSRLLPILHGMVADGDLGAHMRAIFTLLYGLASHKNGASALCSSPDCFMKEFCHKICSPPEDRTQLKDICGYLVKLVQLLVNQQPTWLMSDCLCPKFLVETLSVHVSSYVRSAPVRREDGRLLDGVLVAMNAWHDLNEEWWQNNALGAHLTTFFCNLVEKIDVVKDILSPHPLDILKEFGGWDESMQCD